MKLSVDQLNGNILHMVLDGRLDVEGTQSVESQFKDAAAKQKNVIVDLSKVPFVASMGIRLLVATAKANANGGGKMVVVAPDELTRKIFKTTGLDQLVHVCNSLAEAQASF